MAFEGTWSAVIEIKRDTEEVFELSRCIFYAPDEGFLLFFELNFATINKGGQN